MAQLLVFAADNPAVHTAVGERTGQTITIQAASGCGVYGPYVDLPGGPCVARLTFEGPKHGQVSVDFATDGGEMVLARRPFRLEQVDGDVVEIAANVRQPSSRCEIRLYCEGDVQAALKSVEIEADAPLAVERLIRFELGDGALAGRGVIKGRDMKAGYTRSRWVELEGLRELISVDPDYKAALDATRGRSIVSPQRLMNIFLILKYAKDPVGNIIEFGAYRGGSALFMAALAKRLEKTWNVYALDTFEGMPATDRELDRHRPGGFADVDFAGLEQARDEQGLDNLFLLKGLFDNAVEQIPKEQNKFFLCHIDCDVYASVVFSIEYSKKHATQGAYLILEDPLTWDCLGAMQATEEYIIQKGLFAEQTFPHLVYRYPPLAGHSADRVAPGSSEPPASSKPKSPISVKKK